MIGIDEHTIHKARTFATTIADVTNRRIYDVIGGKSRPIVEKTLMSYKHREKVTMKCMDLSSSYRRFVERCFPNAKVVADRFHVIRMINHHFMEFCKQAQESIRWKRPVIHPLKKRVCNLTAREQQTLKQLFELNPAIGVCYRFKEELCDLLRLKSQTVRQCRRNIRRLREMMSMMVHEAPPQLRK